MLDVRSALRRAMETNRKRPAVVAEDVQLTFEEAWFRGCQLANALLAMGLKAGDKIAVLEAMKMQTTIYASTDGTVDEILVQVGDSVESKDLIARLR